MEAKLKTTNETPPKGPVAIKHARVLQNMVDNGGKSGSRGGISQAARVAGYSEAYIKSGKLQKTKAWVNLTNDLISDEKVLEKHKQLLEKEETFSTREGIVRTGQPHSDVARALDMAYKLKGRYNNTLIVKSELADLSDEELHQRAQVLMAKTMVAFEKKGIIYRVRKTD